MVTGSRFFDFFNIQIRSRTVNTLEKISKILTFEMVLSQYEEVKERGADQVKDFTYIISKDESGTWYTLFPENAQASNAWTKIQEFSQGPISAIHWNGIRKQLRTAGYSVRKAVETKKTSDTDLLSALGL
jgi:hypothetical protein